MLIINYYYQGILNKGMFYLPIEYTIDNLQISLSRKLFVLIQRGFNKASWITAKNFISQSRFPIRYLCGINNSDLKKNIIYGTISLILLFTR